MASLQLFDEHDWSWAKGHVSSIHIGQVRVVSASGIRAQAGVCWFGTLGNAERDGKVRSSEGMSVRMAEIGRGRLHSSPRADRG